VNSKYLGTPSECNDRWLPPSDWTILELGLRIEVMSRNERLLKVARLRQWWTAELGDLASESGSQLGNPSLTSLPEALLVRILVTGPLDARDLARLSCTACVLQRTCEEAARHLADAISKKMWQEGASQVLRPLARESPLQRLDFMLALSATRDQAPQVSAGLAHSVCILLREGKRIVNAFGCNRYGQCGLENYHGNTQEQPNNTNAIGGDLERVPSPSITALYPGAMQWDATFAEPIGAAAAATRSVVVTRTGQVQ